MIATSLNMSGIFIIGMVFAIFVVSIAAGTASVLATHVHNIVDYEWHIWSRTSDDGHLGYLNCDSYNDHCALKIQTSGQIQNISQHVINNKVDEIEAYFDGLKKKMSIDRVSSANSQIKAHDLPMNTPGKAEYELHCTNRFLVWCVGKDSHFEQMIIKINDSPSEIKFSTYEDPDVDPQIYDIKKTLSHELFHAMGIDHNSSSDSIVYYTYVFGPDTGYTATDVDTSDLERRYP